MGSFTELTLAFTFSTATPPEVLRAFGAWRTGEGLLELRPSKIPPREFEADAYRRLLRRRSPAIASLPLLHRAAMWQYLMGWPDNATSGTPATALRWTVPGTVDAHHRTLPKEPGGWCSRLHSPRSVNGQTKDRPAARFVGT